MIVNSRQDIYQYTHDQKQAGFSADVGFDGKPQSFSINGGKTDVDASYKQVTKQTGITANQSTLSVQGQGKFTGGYLITDAGKNQTQFAQGIQTQDIQNHLNYEGDAISVGIGIGVDTSNPNGKAKPALQGIGYGTIDPVNQTSTTHSAITDQAGLSHINTENFKQEEVQHELNEIITNDFDKEQAIKELGAQVTITQAFDAERRAIRSEYAKKAEDYRKEAKDLADSDPRKTELETKAKQIDDNLRLFDGITSALYAPNSNGIIGDVARAASPEPAYQIGQYFKENKLKNKIDGGNRPEEQSANHLLAHAVLGAAVSYATGNDITTGAISGASSEVAAPALADYLYGTKDPELLTQDQKDAITSILNLATVATAYTTTGGNVTDTVNAVEVGKVGVENNWGGEAWAYAVGGGKEYAQSQASLGAYCAQQGGDYATCMGWTKQDLLSSVIELHQKYNHMTIMSVSRGGMEQIFIINNKNGNVYVSVLGINASYDDLKKEKLNYQFKELEPPECLSAGVILRVEGI